MVGAACDVSCGQVRVRCRVFGPPTGPAALLLHAAGQDSSSWDAVAEHLAARASRVVTVDQRGHGASSWSDRYSFEQMRDDIVGVIEALELAPAVVVGHSMGGTVATLLAEQRSDLVRLLVLEDTPPPRRVEQPVVFPERAPAHLTLDPRAWTALMSELANPSPSWWNDLETIAMPVLFIAGGSTSHVPQDELVEAAARVPNARMVTLEGAGHQVHRVQEREFLAELDQFLAQHP